MDRLYSPFPPSTLHTPQSEIQQQNVGNADTICGITMRRMTILGTPKKVISNGHTHCSFRR